MLQRPNAKAKIQLQGTRVHAVDEVTIQLAVLPGVVPRVTVVALTARYRLPAIIFLPEFSPVVLPQAKVVLSQVKIPPAVALDFLLAVYPS